MQLRNAGKWSESFQMSRLGLFFSLEVFSCPTACWTCNQCVLPVCPPSCSSHCGDGGGGCPRASCSCPSATRWAPARASRKVDWDSEVSPNPDCRATLPGSFLLNFHPSLVNANAPPFLAQCNNKKSTKQPSDSLYLKCFSLSVE